MRPKNKRQSPQQPSISPSQTGRLWGVILLALVILFFSAIRFRLRDMPLERDEGEYAYAGQLILQGIAPYALAYNMKLPGTYAAYALMMAVFGQSPAAVHIGMILVNDAAIMLVFLLARRLWGNTAGLAAACTYALLSNSESVLGFAGHATHFVMLCALGGILLLLRALETHRPALYFVSGICMGLAFVMKQPGLVFVVFGAFYIAATQWREPEKRPILIRLAIYGAGTIFPFALTCLWLGLAGQLGRMWFWTYAYARQYGSLTTLWDGWENLFVLGYYVVSSNYLLWILAAVGLAALAWDSRGKHAFFTVAFLVFSWGGVCVGFYFRPHYFILVLPAISLLAGLAVSAAQHELSQLFNRTLATAIPAVLFVIVAVLSVSAQSDFLFRMDPVAACRWAYGNSPFPEAEVIAQYLKQNTKDDARIAILGSEPEIYLYSGRHSATGYIYVYPLFEPQRFAVDMQKEMAKEIEDHHPEYVVLVKVATSWQFRPGADMWMVNWFHNYLAAHYQMVGVADILPSQTRYLWGDAARSYKEESDAALEVYKVLPVSAIAAENVQAPSAR